MKLIYKISVLVLLIQCTSKKDEIIFCPPPFTFNASIENDSENITKQYRFAYGLGENKTAKSPLIIHRDSFFFNIPPNYNSDSIYICFVKQNFQIDTIGITYKRKIAVTRNHCSKIDVDIYNSELFFVSNQLNKDSCKVKDVYYLGFTSFYGSIISLRKK